MLATKKIFVLAGVAAAVSTVVPELAMWPAQAAPVVRTEQTVSRLLNGVGSVKPKDEFAAVSVYGPNAFAVLTGQGGRTHIERDGQKLWQPLEIPVVAAAEEGQTRVIAVASASLWSAENLAIPGNARFFTNLLRWAGEAKSRKRPVYGAITTDASLAEWLKRQDFAVAPASLENLAGVDVLVLNAQSLTESQLPPLRAFLARGGRLIIAANGANWSNANSYYDGNLAFAAEFAGNELLRPYGLAFSRSTASFLTEAGYEAKAPAVLTSGAKALETAQAVITGNKTISSVEGAQLGLTVKEMAVSISPQDTVVLPMLKALANNAPAVVPFERRPVTVSDVGPRLLLTLQTALVNKTPLEEIKPSPAGALFPGDLPVKPVAEAVSKTVSITTERTEWESTGLYAAPGVPITVTVPEELANKGLAVRIGCHTDGLWGLDSWKRPPAISRIAPLREVKTTFVNPYGGLVYIVVPNRLTTHPGRIYATKNPAGPYGGPNPLMPAAYPAKFDVTVDGAFEAPYFVLGQTSVQDWKTRIRNLPGPWAELQGRNIVLSVPSRNVRDIEDPTQVIKIYDDALDYMADFVGLARDGRRRRERMVVDTQISAGYMHSGYPVMMQMDQEKRAVDVALLEQRSWGQWHELGHNHQSQDWTFDGTVEVTNNLFALYVLEKIYHKLLRQASAQMAASFFATEWSKYEGAKFDYAFLKNDPILFLHMYGQLRESFGWETFQKVFAEYRDLEDAQRPKNDAQKRDQWMVRLSRAAGRNLGPFFEKWHVPTSQAARDSIQDLPVWMPQWPIADATIKNTAQ